MLRLNARSCYENYDFIFFLDKTIVIVVTDLFLCSFGFRNRDWVFIFEYRSLIVCLRKILSGHLKA